MSDDSSRDGTSGSLNDRSRCVARFEIRYSQFLDHTGRVVAPVPEFARDPRALVPLYKAMVLMRVFDTKSIALQRTGQLGTYASILGQEATLIALGSAMAPDDVLLPSYRETAAMIMRGVRMTDILLYWGGDERGMSFAKPSQDFPICVPIASHAPHAVGVAYALARRGQRQVAVCALGDGATSKGDFYEAINAAGLWQLPVIFLISNNQWAISVPRRAQTRAQTLAQKAVAAGIPGEQVDGNDVIAVRHGLDRALERARSGDGPCVIEALTYRMSDHTTADDSRRYRSEQEVQEHRELDPIERTGKYLLDQGAWTDEDETAHLERSTADVEQAVAEYLATPPRPASSMFEHLFETLPAAFAAQRDELANVDGDG